MNCPNCDGELKLSERQGVEIDYCPNCRGVWLDRGELDKIIERSASYNQAPRYANDSERREYDDDDNRPYEKKKRKSFLDDLFDF